MIPLAIPLLAGGAGVLGGFLMGGSKKTSQIEKHAPQEHFAPTFGAKTYSPVVSEFQQLEQSYIGPTYVISSPKASVKKEATLGQEGRVAQTPQWNIPTSGAQREEKMTEGLNVTNIAIIAVVGAIAVTAVGAFKPAKRRRK